MRPCQDCGNDHQTYLVHRADEWAVLCAACGGRQESTAPEREEPDHQCQRCGTRRVPVSWVTGKDGAYEACQRCAAWLRGELRASLTPRKSGQLVGVRVLVRMRDGHRCRYCGRTDQRLTFDHVLPRSRGGLNTFENLVLACAECNEEKGSLTPEEAGMPLLPVPERNAAAPR